MSVPGSIPRQYEPAVLQAETFRPAVEAFNAADQELYVQEIPNSRSWEFLAANIPLLECPDRRIQEVYYFRWWTFRKHLRRTDQGFVFTEFLAPVGHAGPGNTISCALGHHIAEGRWLGDRRYLDQDVLFWLRGEGGGPQKHLHKYSSWLAHALLGRFCVDGREEFLVDLLDDLVADYRQWETERLLPDGLFWQYDVRDAMEESISGSRTARNARPTLNSYMYGNARAIAAVARARRARGPGRGVCSQGRAAQGAGAGAPVGRRGAVLQGPPGGRRPGRRPRAARLHAVVRQPARRRLRGRLAAALRRAGLCRTLRADDGGAAASEVRHRLRAATTASGTGRAGRSPRP